MDSEDPVQIEWYIRVTVQWRRLKKAKYFEGIEDEGDGVTHSVLAGWEREGVPEKVQITNHEYRESNAKFLLTKARRVEVLKRAVARGKRG